MQHHFIIELNMYNQVENIAKVLDLLDILLHHRGRTLSSRPKSISERLLRVRSEGVVEQRQDRCQAPGKEDEVDVRVWQDLAEHQA